MISDLLKKKSVLFVLVFLICSIPSFAFAEDNNTAQKDIKDAEYYINLAVSYLELDKYQEAVDPLKQAIKIKPDNAKAYFLLGFSYSELDKYKEAVDAFKKGIKLQPDDDQAHYDLGMSYGMLGKWKEAVDALKQVIRIKPDDAIAHYYIGLAYKKLYKWKEVVDASKQAINLKPDFADAHLNLGIAYGMLYKNQEAIDALKQAISIKPDSAEAHINLGLVYMTIKDKDSAFDEYKILKNLDEEKADYLFVLLNNKSSNDDEKALSTESSEIDLDIIYELDKQDSDTIPPAELNKHKKLMYKAYKQEQLNPPEEREKHFTDMIKKYPDNPAYYFQRANAMIFGSPSDYEKAFRMYLRGKETISEILEEDFLKSMSAGSIYFKRYDLDNDDQPEILLANLDGIHNWSSFIIDKNNDEWQINHIKVFGEWFQGIKIVDLNNNNIPDIIFEHFGGGRGSYDFGIYEYPDSLNSSLGGASDKYLHLHGKIAIEDIGSDGFKEIICSFYLNGEDWAEYYKWDGNKYSVYKEEKQKSL